jgi:hypothetical protein
MSNDRVILLAEINHLFKRQAELLKGRLDSITISEYIETNRRLRELVEQIIGCPVHTSDKEEVAKSDSQRGTLQS